MDRSDKYKKTIKCLLTRQKPGCKIHPYKAKALWKNIRSAFCRIKENRTLCFR